MNMEITADESYMKQEVQNNEGDELAVEDETNERAVYLDGKWFGPLSRQAVTA